MSLNDFRSGFVSIVGRPNVGKSTLVNRLVGQKVAIVSDKPQTTRNRILAVVNWPPEGQPPGRDGAPSARGQIVLFDTPGIHKPMHRMNERMVDTAVHTLDQVDLVVWVVEVDTVQGPEELRILDLLRKSGKPLILGINKIDTVAKPRLLPIIDRYQRLANFLEIVPLSALRGENVERLGDLLVGHLPVGEALYPEDFLTDQPERFFVAEIVREQILRLTRDEIPYTTAVIVESFKEDQDLVRIEASVLVERDSQKGIVIGKGGSMLKAVGSAARVGIEAFLGTKVYLGLFVKVREGWREDRRTLEDLGLGDKRG